jgi:SAM-dependent methyltransferase
MFESELEKYYREHSSELGWGNDVVRLDPERLELLNRYIVGHRILDVACGSGIYTDYLANLGCDAWGIDLVSDFIENAKKTKKGVFIQGEADKLPFKDGEFDTVLLFDILEHGDEIAMLQEAKRVASKRILVNVPRKVDRELEESGVVFRHYTDKSHLREYLRKDIQLLANNCGLSVAEIVDVNAVDPYRVQNSMFVGNQLSKRIVRMISKRLLGEKYYPTGLFAVIDK